ncbi:MAG: hypothetical protein IT159_07425 [Bryobacterales bacterium]|nr:hypothetical protein [Bryobacterales bacterium]
MRFFRLGFPQSPRILLVESGSRRLLEGVIPYLRGHFGSQAPLELLTCYAGKPAGLGEGSAVYQTHHHQGRKARKRLYRTLAENGVGVLVILCSAEPIMTKWKWALALNLPARVLVVNENGDAFWLDRTNWKTILHFVLFRAGLTGGDAVRTLTQALLFPLTLLYLLVYAGAIHLRRKVRV